MVEQRQAGKTKLNARRKKAESKDAMQLLLETDELEQPCGNTQTNRNGLIPDVRDTQKNA